MVGKEETVNATHAATFDVRLPGEASFIDFQQRQNAPYINF
jgi:hypothetical protein